MIFLLGLAGEKITWKLVELKSLLACPRTGYPRQQLLLSRQLDYFQLLLKWLTRLTLWFQLDMTSIEGFIRLLLIAPILISFLYLALAFDPARFLADFQEQEIALNDLSMLFQDGFSLIGSDRAHRVRARSQLILFGWSQSSSRQLTESKHLLLKSDECRSWAGKVEINQLGSDRHTRLSWFKRNPAFLHSSL